MTTNTATGTQTETIQPRLPIRLVEEHTFTTADGVRLFFRFWPATDVRKGAVLLLHRGHEHSGRVAHLVEEFERDYLEKTLVACRGNISRAARMAGKDRRSFFALLKKYGIGHAPGPILESQVIA